MKSILIVEDNPLIVELIAQMLSDDYEVSSAPNGEAGVAAARERRPDLILMDLMMPVMDGWEAIRALRSVWATCRIPIIAVSATTDLKERRRADQAGADAHLGKPIDEDELRATIARYL
ncbi:MAG: response regulator [Sandaracinaceae bacterium]|nr:response regulator [Sandaracinaceae bacterium]